MSAADAPDWERIITTVKAAGDVPDAPDWERIVVGPGGTPVGGAANVWDGPAAWGLLGWGFGPWSGTAATANYSGAEQLLLGLVSVPDGGTSTNLVLYDSGPVVGAVGWTGVLYETGSPTNRPYLGVGGSQGDLVLVAQTAAGALDSLLTGSTAVVAPWTASATLEAGYWYYAGFLTGTYSAAGQFMQINPAAPSAWPLPGTVPVGGRLNGTYASPPASVAASWASTTEWLWAGVY